MTRARARFDLVTDARDGGKRFVVRADERLTAFLELESAIKAKARKARDFLVAMGTACFF